MGSWESSVEKRLDSLDRRVGSIESTVGDIKTDTAVLRTEFGHLPTKGFMLASVLGLLTLIAALIAFAEQIQSFVN